VVAAALFRAGHGFLDRVEAGLVQHAHSCRDRFFAAAAVSRAAGADRDAQGEHRALPIRLIGTRRGFLSSFCGRVSGQHSMELIGYVPFGVPPQMIAGSHAVLGQIGCDRIVPDWDRRAGDASPSFADVGASLVAGDTIAVVNLDALAPSLGQLVLLIESLTRRGVGFRSLADGIDTMGGEGRHAGRFSRRLPGLSRRRVCRQVGGLVRWLTGAAGGRGGRV
jgi:hypothetical protein